MKAIRNHIQVIAMIDTLAIAKRLKSCNLPEEAAEAIAQELKASTENGFERFATKEDVQMLGSKLESDMATLQSKMTADMATLRSELRADMANLRGELKAEIAHAKNTMSLFAASQFTALIAIIIKLFNVF